MTIYRVEDLRFGFGDTEILRGISLQFQSAQMAAVVGPNGAGKSTLMSVLSGFRDDYTGHCFFRDVEIRDWKKRELGRQMTFIPQMIRLEFPFTAGQVVFMGRTPHCHGLFESEEDREAVRKAMEITETTAFADREFRELSGGERQRVVLAGALAQEPKVLLLDEPTTFLDLKHQISTYSLLQRLAREGIAIIAVTHDLNLAANYADRIVVMSQGQVAADGEPEKILTSPMLKEVFEVDAEIRQGPQGRPWVFCENPDAYRYPDAYRSRDREGAVTPPRPVSSIPTHLPETSGEPSPPRLPPASPPKC